MNQDLSIDSNGVIQSPGNAFAAEYNNSPQATKLKFRNNTEIVFGKSASGKIKSVTNGKNKSILSDDCNLDQTIANGNELLYDRKACLNFADLYRKLGMSSKEVFACGNLLKSVSKLIDDRNIDLKKEGLSIPKITDTNSLEVGGFVYSCADHLSFEQIEDGAVKGTFIPYSIAWLTNAFSGTPTVGKKGNAGDGASVK
jgi:hypothetical protein